MQGNVPLQQRAGKNPEPRAYFNPVGRTARSRVFRAVLGDNVLLSGSDKESRVLPIKGEEAAFFLNNTGGSINYSALYVDEQNNEYLLESGSVADGSQQDVSLSEGGAGLLPGEKIILRITGGDPTAGDGLNVRVAYQTVSEDLVNVRKDILDTSLADMFSPSAGEIWLLMGQQESESLLIANGDDIDHYFDIYISEGGQDFLFTKNRLMQAGRMGEIGALEVAPAISYGQTYKVKMKEAKHTANSRILFFGTLSVAALSKDDTP
jgi:hypothetical protein